MTKCECHVFPRFLGAVVMASMLAMVDGALAQQGTVPERGCVPGLQVGCVCADGRPGGQVCAADGARFLSCLCEGPSVAILQNAHAERVEQSHQERRRRAAVRGQARWTAYGGLGAATFSDVRAPEIPSASERASGVVGGGSSGFTGVLSFALGRGGWLGGPFSYQVRASLGLGVLTQVHEDPDPNLPWQGTTIRVGTVDETDPEPIALTIPILLRVDATARLGPLAWKFPWYLGAGPSVGVYAVPGVLVGGTIGLIGETGFVFGHNENIDVGLRVLLPWLTYVSAFEVTFGVAM